MCPFLLRAVTRHGSKQLPCLMFCCCVSYRYQTDIAHIIAKNIHFKSEQFSHNSGLLMAYGWFSLSHNNIVAISSSKSPLKYVQHVAVFPASTTRQPIRRHFYIATFVGYMVVIFKYPLHILF